MEYNFVLKKKEDWKGGFKKKIDKFSSSLVYLSYRNTDVFRAIWMRLLCWSECKFKYFNQLHDIRGGQFSEVFDAIAIENSIKSLIFKYGATEVASTGFFWDLLVHRARWLLFPGCVCCPEASTVFSGAVDLLALAMCFDLAFSAF